ncbi:MAG: hypothetical protein AB8F95_08030 [Bacteroidia bacterium]
MQTYAAFPISLAHYKQAKSVIEAIRQEPDERPNRQALVSIVNELADVGIDHFFLDSIRYAGMSKFKIKAAELGLQTFKAGLQPLLRNIVFSLSTKQITRIVDFMEGIFVESE